MVLNWSLLSQQALIKAGLPSGEKLLSSPLIFGSTYDYGNLMDMPNTAHFLITFSDGQKENLTLHYNGFTGMARFFIDYHWNITEHVSPRAGVITGNSEVLFNGWQFLVIPGN